MEIEKKIDVMLKEQEFIKFSTNCKVHETYNQMKEIMIGSLRNYYVKGGEEVEGNIEQEKNISKLLQTVLKVNWK